MTVRYTAAEGIRVLDFGDESVVFNPLSWDAHLLNAAAAGILDLLGEGPRSASELEIILREVLLESERPQAALHAQRLLQELAQLGLVRLWREDAVAGR